MRALLDRVWARMREHERLFMISLATMLVMAGQGVVAPILPLYADGFGVSTAMVGMTLTIFGLARLVVNVPAGILSDRYGRRLLLVGGPLVTCAGMLGSGAAPGIYVLLLWRFVAGAGSAMYMTGAHLYLVDISTPRNRARFLGTNQGALLTGVSLGPGIGGLIAEGFGLRAPFYVVGVGAFIAAAYSFLRLPETSRLHEEEEAASAGAEGNPGTPQQGSEPAGGASPAEPSRARRPWLQFALSADFVAVALVTMAIFSIRTGARGTLMPLIGADRFGMSPGTLGGLFTGTAVIGLLLIAPAAMVSDRFGRKPAIVPAGFVGAAGIVLMAAAPSPVLFVVASMVMAVGTGIAGPAPAAYMGDIAPPELRGVAMGLYRSAGDFGFVAGPVLLGALADAASMSWALMANAAVVAVAAVLFALRASESQRR